MNVLLLAPHPFFQNRGTPIAERALIEVLTSHGHRVDVLAFHEGEDVSIAGCTVHRIPRVPGVRGVRPGFSVKKLVCDAVMFFTALKLARGGGYQVVHAVEESAFMALAVKALFGTPYVYDMDSSLVQQMIDKYPWLRMVRGPLEVFEATAVRKSAAVVAVCKALEDVALEYDPAAAVARVEDFSLLPETPPTVESLSDTIGRGGPIVLYVGNLESYQGIDLLLDGFEHALPRVADAQLVVIGGRQADIDRYTELAAAAGLTDNVHFLGPRPVDDLGGFLVQAEVVVSPRTQGQNTPMKIYSYLDSGRPVLATRLPTHTQVMTDEIAMLAEPEGEAFGSALANLLEDPELRARLAAAAKDKVRQEFSRDAFRRKVLAFYDLVTERIGLAAPEAP